MQRQDIWGEYIMQMFCLLSLLRAPLLLLLLCLLLNRTGTSSRNVEFAEEMRNTFQMIYRNRQPFILSSLCVLSTVVLIWHKNCQFTVLSCSIFLYDDNNSHTMIILFLFIHCCHWAVGGWFGWLDGWFRDDKQNCCKCMFDDKMLCKEMHNEMEKHCNFQGIKCRIRWNSCGI